MARLARFFLPNQPIHVIHRGKGGRRVFFGKGDYERYRGWLAEAAEKYGCAVHAYVLMPNHVQLLVTPRTPRSLPRLLQSLGRRHTRHVNAARDLDGARWEGRYRAAPIEAGAHLLDCMRYIEGEPVREGLAGRARAYPWSSHGAYAEGDADPVVSEHRLYREVAATAAKRQRVYRELSRAPFAKGFPDALLAAVNGGWAFGSPSFQRRIGAASGRRVAPLPRGRPRKAKAAAKRRKRA